MKRTILLLLAAALCFGLCGCKSEETIQAETLIDAIGDVSLDSAEAILAAEEAYAGLSERNQEKVENAALLSAARKSYNIIYAETQIDAIGEVTLDSADSLIAAEAALAALDPESQALVSNAGALAEGWDRLEYLRLQASLCDTWVHEIAYSSEELILEDTANAPVPVSLSVGGYHTYDTVSFSLLEDGSFCLENTVVGTWSLAEDLSSVTLLCEPHEMTLRILQEDGFTKLQGELFETLPFAYVREADFETVFAMKYEVVTLTDENIREYCGDSVDLGTAVIGGERHYMWVHDSVAYDKGLVYLGCDVTVYYDSGGTTMWDNFPVMRAADRHFPPFVVQRGSGQMYYVKEDYVAENYVNESGVRVLTLTNGSQLIFDGDVVWDAFDHFWRYVDAHYGDYMY